MGHAFSALQAHDFARAWDGRFLLRIEDIDGTRSRPDHVAGIIEDLGWLGLAWDGDVVLQSQRLPLYKPALDRLKAMGLAYPCFCTRAEIAREIAESGAAPHESGPVYPGTCRGLHATDRMHEPHAWRLDMAAAVARMGPLAWTDLDAGTIAANPLLQGDVVIARKDAPVSYHLAVTVDDAAQGITHVIRGQDLFAATHIHRLLQALLGLPTPVYRHHPLLTGADGKRLAKRDGASSLAELRLGGADPAALVEQLRAAAGGALTPKRLYS
jgi:glutamyl-Q tRNA(Asp) synthetase